jgi:hypothetical protein
MKVSPGMNTARPIGGGGGVFTILQEDPAPVTTSEAILLLSAVVPANSLTATSGALILTGSSDLLAAVGGAARNISAAGMVVRNSTGGVPNDPLSYAQIINAPGFEGWGHLTSTIILGLLPDALNNIQLTFNGFFALAEDNDDRNACTTVYSNGSASEIGFGAFDPSTQPAVDWTQEVLFQYVLVQNNAGACIPPVNFTEVVGTTAQLLLVT